MKLCYLSVFRDATGYSVASQGTALGIDAAGVDIVCRNIKLTTQDFDPPKRIQELLAKDANGVDVVVQHCLPPSFVYKGGVKNIGYYHAETTHFKPSAWQYYCNLMDECWVSCGENVEAAKKSGITVPVKVVPIPCDPSTYKVDYKPLDIGIGNRFAFYHIGDYSSRKNIRNLISCYFRTFSKNDNVVLVLKSYLEGKTSAESAEFIRNEINSVKQSLRRFGVDMYPPIIIISEYLPPEAIMRLHTSCDCFVSLERGAAWNLPSFDAAAFGNWVIVNGWGGQNQFINEKNGVLLDYKMTNVEGMVLCPYTTLYTAYEQWAEPDYDQCCQAMINAYHGRSTSDPTWILDEFSLEKAGAKIRKVLES